MLFKFIVLCRAISYITSKTIVNPHAAPVNYGMIIKPNPVTGEVTENHVVAMITNVSIDFDNVVNILFI